ncbi:YibE/F family protein [Macrococcus sp. DPC7161]|uniref:YibE/F family protein n=1 Tax=Macrococcus sp. DPC7161 TaxID=2507060 RepID=UPI00100BCA7D|nr:YibE/F family protein [Macrococcus sp. DPC7161]RXK18411.1 YibE/F family protein [Macrococcus sp. DPC7161]
MNKKRYQLLRPATLIAYVLMIVTLIGSIIFTMYNDHFYQSPIGEVIKRQITSEHKTVDQVKNKDIQYTEKLTLKVTNRDNQIIHIKNTFMKSKAYSHQYDVGNKVLLSKDLKSIDEAKRDTVIVSLLSLFIFLIVTVGLLQGAMSLLSLVTNIIMSGVVLFLYKHYPTIPLFGYAIIAVIIATIITLILTNGYNTKTKVAIVSTLIGTTLTIIIVQLAIVLTDAEGIRYETMTFLTIAPKTVFLTSILIGSLGAIMDIAITITSALYEIKMTQKNVTRKALVESGFEIGKDIMGPMTNILFFAYLSGSIPMIILYLRNLSPINHSFYIHWSLEINRAITGSIGIVLAIPVTIYLCAYFFTRERAQ